MKYLKESKAITLIALIITIIVLLILAGVVINMTLGNDGIINKAQSAVDMYKNAQEEETAMLNYIDNSIIGKRGTEILNDDSKKFIMVYLDGVPINDIPSQDSHYRLSNISCTNGAIATFDTDTWSISISNITTSNTVCRIDFTANNVYSMIMRNLDNDSYLESVFSNEEYAIKIVQDEELMSEICENSKLRNLLYDNANIYESLIANSDIALNAMKNSSRYEVICKTGQNKTFYADKAFVLGYSTQGAGGSYSTGTWVNGSFTYYPDRGNSSNGLEVLVNKFGSNVVVNGTYGVSYEWDNNMYAAIFKI